MLFRDACWLPVVIFGRLPSLVHLKLIMFIVQAVGWAEDFSFITLCAFFDKTRDWKFFVNRFSSTYTKWDGNDMANGQVPGGRRRICDKGKA